MKYRLISALAALLLLNAAACRKGTGSSPTPAQAPGQLVSRVIYYNATGSPTDTTIITYNADSTVHQATNANASNSITTYYYSAGLVKAVASSGTTVFLIDSIVLNAQGERAADYILHPSGSSQYDFTRLFTYNASGEPTQIISFYPNMSGSTPDTATLVWLNGDLMSETSTGHKNDHTYTYDITRPCQAGDITYFNYRISIGLKRKLSTHLCTGISDPLNGNSTVNYSYDNQGRIASYTATQGTNIIARGAYDYVP